MILISYEALECQDQGGDSKNVLRKFVRFFVTLGLKILRLLSLKVVFKADIINECC